MSAAFDNELVKISGRYVDKGAFHRAIMIAREMLEAGEWDGKSELWIDDPYAIYNRLRDDNSEGRGDRAPSP